MIDNNQTNQQTMLALFKKITNDIPNNNYAALAAIIPVLHALNIFHLTSHWKITGRSSYSDHLLFERLYNDIRSELDDVAERVVGIEQPATIDPAKIMHHSTIALLNICKQPNTQNPESMLMTALGAEQSFLGFLNIVVSVLHAGGLLTRGIDNMLGEIYDTHESHVYLLKQRLNRL